VKKTLFTGIAVLFLATGAAVPDELLTEPDKSVFAAKIVAFCTTRLRSDRYSPPFTEEQISSYCRCASSTLADITTKDEYAARDRRLVPSYMEKLRCVTVEKCKKHLNLAYPQKCQYEQCWKS
jgi:hypothetical protein